MFLHLFPGPITISSLFCSAFPLQLLPYCQEIPPAVVRNMRVPRKYLLVAWENKGGEEQRCFLLAGDVMSNVVILGGTSL